MDSAEFGWQIFSEGRTSAELLLYVCLSVCLSLSLSLICLSVSSLPLALRVSLSLMRDLSLSLLLPDLPLSLPCSLVILSIVSVSLPHVPSLPPSTLRRPFATFAQKNIRENDTSMDFGLG